MCHITHRLVESGLCARSGDERVVYTMRVFLTELSVLWCAGKRQNDSPHEGGEKGRKRVRQE